MITGDIHHLEAYENSFRLLSVSVSGLFGI